MSDLGHLQPAFRPNALLSAEERISWIGQDRWIGYPRADQVLVRLQQLLAYPPRDRMPCLLLFGATGTGKTRIIQKFLRDNRSSFDETTGTTRVPVASMQMPPAPSERDFQKELLTGLHIVVPAGLSATALRHRSRVAARQLSVRMVVIDEIHSMLAGTFREQRIFLNAIRFLANDLRVLLVCVGTQEAKQALMTDQQLADPCEACELPARRDDAALTQLLVSIASVLPLRQQSDVRNPQLQKRVYNLTEGVMVRLCRLLEEAALRGIENGQERTQVDSLTDDLMAHTMVSISDRRSRRVAG